MLSPVLDARFEDMPSVSRSSNFDRDLKCNIHRFLFCSRRTVCWCSTFAWPSRHSPSEYRGGNAGRARHELEGTCGPVPARSAVAACRIVRVFAGCLDMRGEEGQMFAFWSPRKVVLQVTVTVGCVFET